MKSYAIPIILSLCLCNLVLGNSWVARNGDNGDEEAYALAVDSSGNVYVTGTRNADVNGFDYLTVKYDQDGDWVWESGYNGPSNGSDIAYAIALDNAGDVYVTGTSYDDANSNDYLTIKYSSSDGEQLWATRYDGTGNDYDNACAIAVSPAGNVYVTGQSAGSTTGTDYATVKYNSSGVQQWVSRYNYSSANYDTAYAIAVDSAGNAYVTGSSVSGTTGNDYATIKYTNSYGSQSWVQRYYPSSYNNNYDCATAIVIDDSNNVYITGVSDANYVTIKYNSSGSIQWGGAKRYDGSANGYDSANAIALDASGNVYVTGQSAGSGTGNDYATVKYNSSGVQQWVGRHNYSLANNDSAKAIAVDSAGNAYVTGGSVSTTTGSDYATIKYDTDGNQQWEARYNGPAHNEDQANDLAVDGSGNVYVTGTSHGGWTYKDFATIKNPNEVPYCSGPVVGDFNLDCVVDFLDFGEFASHWLETNLQ